MFSRDQDIFYYSENLIRVVKPNDKINHFISFTMEKSNKLFN